MPILPIKDEMTASLTYKSYDQAHLTGLASEYDKIAEYEMIVEYEMINKYNMIL